MRINIYYLQSLYYIIIVMMIIIKNKGIRKKEEGEIRFLIRWTNQRNKENLTKKGREKTNAVAENLKEKSADSQQRENQALCTRGEDTSGS